MSVPNLAFVAAVLAVVLLLALAALGLPALAALAEAAGLAGASTFHRKLAQQLSRAGLWLLVDAVALGGAAGLLLANQRPELTAPWLANPAPLQPAAALLVALVALETACTATWRPLRNLRPLHLLLSVLTALTAMALLGALWALAALAVLTPGAAVTALSPQDLWALCASVVREPLRLAPLGLAWGMSLAAGGCAGLLYLLWRRDKDDFGRDYYAFALRFSALLAAASGALQCGFHAWAAVLLKPWSSPLLLPWWGAAAGLSVLSALLLGLVAASAPPRRHKPTVILGSLALLASLAALAAVVLLALA